MEEVVELGVVRERPPVRLHDLSVDSGPEAHQPPHQRLAVLLLNVRVLQQAEYPVRVDLCLVVGDLGAYAGKPLNRVDEEAREAAVAQTPNRNMQG